MTHPSHPPTHLGWAAMFPWMLDQLDEAIALFSPEQRLVYGNQPLVDQLALDPDWLQTQPLGSDFVQRIGPPRRWSAEQMSGVQQAMDRMGRSPHPSVSLDLCDPAFTALRLTPHPDGGFLLTLRPNPLGAGVSILGLATVNPSDLDQPGVWQALSLQPADPEMAAQTCPEERLRLLESVVVHANDCIMIAEAEPLEPPGPRILYVNPAFTRITGYLPEEVIGKTPRLLQGPNTDRATLARLRESLRNWETVVVELLNYRKDGSEFWVEVSVVPVMNPEGRCTHWIAVERDITQRKQIETELRHMLQKQIEVSQMRSRFVSMTSHEFRTPLTSILAASELLEYYGHDWTEEEKREQLHLIQSTVQHLTQLLDDILLLGRSEGGSLEVCPLWFDVVKFCHNLTGAIQKGVGRDHLVTFEPQTSHPVVFLDKKLLQRILTNLLSNAAKYSPNGTLIFLGLQQDEETLVITVQDEGIGIPLDDQAHLFDFFYRGNNVGMTPGTGLGLAIVKTCVDLCKGQIRVESVPNKGTVFRVMLPAPTRSLSAEVFGIAF